LFLYWIKSSILGVANPEARLSVNAMWTSHKGLTGGPPRNVTAEARHVTRRLSYIYCCHRAISTFHLYSTRTLQ
jgi:hypothetical protein